MTVVRRLDPEPTAHVKNRGDGTRLRLDSMIKNWLTTLREIGDSIYDVFLIPGDFVLSQFVTHAPSSALRLGIGAEGDGVVSPAVLSLLIWLLLVFVFLKLVGLMRNIARYTNAVIRTVGFRAFDRVRGIKTKLVCKLRRLIPLRGSSNADTIVELELDNLDLVVLRTGAALAPGFRLSAPEIAGRLTARPAQVQCSLDKLRKYKLVRPSIGSTDGFDNYRLTRSAAKLLTGWQRKSTGS